MFAGRARDGLRLFEPGRVMSLCAMFVSGIGCAVISPTDRGKVMMWNVLDGIDPSHRRAGIDCAGAIE